MSELAAFDWRLLQRQNREGQAIGRILIMRQNDGSGLVIADGFHRTCALFAGEELITSRARARKLVSNLVPVFRAAMHYSQRLPRPIKSIETDFSLKNTE